MSKGMSSRSVVWRCSPPAKRLRGGARGDIEGGGPVVIWGVAKKFCNHLTSAPLHNAFSTSLFASTSPIAGDPPPSNQSHGGAISLPPELIPATGRECPNARGSQVMPYVGDK